MKQLTCEMCGSTDLIKTDGYFVCQFCGCKYTVEEAKKIMIDGVVEVQGTVSVDNTELLQNTVKNAHRARGQENWEEAELYYNKAKELDSTNAEFIFYSSYAKAHLALEDSSPIKRQRAVEVFNKTLSGTPRSFFEVDNTFLKVDIYICKLIIRASQFSNDDEREIIEREFANTRSAWIGKLFEIFNQTKDKIIKRNTGELIVYHCEKANLNRDTKSKVDIAFQWLYINNALFHTIIAKEKRKPKKSAVVLTAFGSLFLILSIVALIVWSGESDGIGGFLSLFASAIPFLGIGITKLIRGRTDYDELNLMENMTAIRRAEKW